jgi:glutamate---cysteine ligase / carboxylate-amine ligase
VSGRTVGVEEEVLLVGLDDGRPRPLGEQVIATADADESGPDGSGVEHEFKREQAEIDSLPHASLEDLAEDLLARRADLAAAAARHGLGVAPVGTSPVGVRPHPTDDERYRTMGRLFGLTAREALSCGCHVHVEVESREEGVAVLDRVRPWLSVLTALSANSPFWQEEDTGYASYRTMVWSRFPSSGPMALFHDVDGYDAAVAALLESGTILDTGMVYFDARLSASYPTVEFRVADVCPVVDDTVLLAALCRALVETAAAEWRAGVAPVDVRVELLRAATWRAARSGLSGDLVDVAARAARPARERVAGLVAHLTPALDGTGDTALVTASLDRLERRGTGADLQRRDLAASGSFAEVTLAAVHRSAGAQGNKRAG